MFRSTAESLPHPCQIPPRFPSSPAEQGVRGFFCAVHRASLDTAFRDIPGMSLATLNDIFYAIVSREQSERVTLHRRDASWVATSRRRNCTATSSGVAQALGGWGIAKGDRVAILSENRPEWTIADFACQLLGLVSVPIYSTLTAEQSEFILQDSCCACSSFPPNNNCGKYWPIISRTAGGENRGHGPRRNRPTLSPWNVSCTEGPVTRDPALDARARTISALDLATIIYTSGTTGVAKGVMLTHGNLASNIEFSLKGFDLGWRAD